MCQQEFIKPPFLGNTCIAKHAVSTSAPMDPASKEKNAFSELISTLLQPQVLSQVRPSLSSEIHMIAQ